jgi:hypothetical protein
MDTSSVDILRFIAQHGPSAIATVLEKLNANVPHYKIASDILSGMDAGQFSRVIRAFYRCSWTIRPEVLEILTIIGRIEAEKLDRLRDRTANKVTPLRETDTQHR